MSNKRTSYQGGTLMDVSRHMIKNAPYNPRTISEYAKNLLRKKIKEVGCVTSLVWNRRTGNLVSGHQRLACMDEIEGTHDYDVLVRALDVDEKAEREMNVALNSKTTQGEFDKDSLLALLGEGMDMADAGFTRIDLEFEFGDLPELNGVFATEAASAAEVVSGLEEIAGASPWRSSMKKARKEHIAAEQQKPKNDADYYAMVVFEPGQLAGWLKAHGLPENSRYVMAAQLRL